MKSKHVTIIDAQNAEKQNHCKLNLPQTNNNWNTTPPNHIEKTLTQEEINLEELFMY